VERNLNPVSVMVSASYTQFIHLLGRRGDLSLTMTNFPSSLSTSSPLHFHRSTPSPLDSSPHYLLAHLSHALLGASPNGEALDRVLIRKLRASTPSPCHPTQRSCERYSISYTVTVPSPSLPTPFSPSRPRPLSYAAAVAGALVVPRYSIRVISDVAPITAASHPSGKAATQPPATEEAYLPPPLPLPRPLPLPVRRSRSSWTVVSVP
jgi:hypothetical protein